MSWELDNLKREVHNFKYDLTRKVDNEDFNRVKNDLDKAERKLQYQENRILELERKLEELTQLLNDKGEA